MTKRSQARKRALYGVDSDGHSRTYTAPTNTTAPTIVGTPQVGVPTGVNLGVWTGNNVGIAYQWKIAGANVAGAKGATYTPAASDGTKALSVDVTVTNPAGTLTKTTATATVSP